MLEEDAECPQCHTKNLRGNHLIILDDHLRAYCHQCGHEWDFIAKEKS